MPSATAHRTPGCRSRGEAAPARLVAAALLLLSVTVACAPRKPVEVLYFYSAICPSCEESQRSERGMSSLVDLGHTNRRVELEVWDVYRDSGAQDALFAALDTYRVPLEKQGLPLLMVNGTAYSGLEEVERAIAELPELIKEAARPGASERRPPGPSGAQSGK